LPRVIILTGEKGVGKSSIVRAALARVKCKIGGFFTVPVETSAQRVGYELLDLQTGEKRIFARRVPGSHAPRGGPFVVDQEVFNSFGTQVIERARQSADIVVMDEIGCMEQGALVFQEAIRGCLRSGIPVLCVVQLGGCSFVRDLLATYPGDVLQVSFAEQERICSAALAKLKQWGVRVHE